MNFTPEPPQKLMIDKIIKQDIVYALVGMGIGKTASVLSAFCQLQRDLEVNSMLIIAPMRVCNLTWPMEVQQWDQFKHLKVANLRTPLGRRAFIGGMADIYLINYESIHTLVKLVEKRGDTLPYQMIVYDECFPAGTLVDTPGGPTPIELIEKGSSILNVLGEDCVYETYRNRVHAVAIITTKGGRKITCSTTHRFLTPQGWVAAEHLSEEETLISRASGMRVVQDHVCAEQGQLRLERSVQPNVCDQTSREAEEGEKRPHPKAGEGLSRVWGEFCADRPTPENESLLREILLGEMADEGSPTAIHIAVENKNIRISESVVQCGVGVGTPSGRANRKLAPDAKAKCSNQVEQDPQSYGAQTSYSGRQWEAHPSASNGALQFPTQTRQSVVGIRVHRADEEHPLRGDDAEILPAGHCLRRKENLAGDRRGHAQGVQSQGRRQEKDRRDGDDRVESVEILQSDDPRLDGFRDADGFIYFYDLGVTRHPSYSVESLLVHNCTKAKNPASKRINLLRKSLLSPPRRIALTGTPAPNSLLDLFAQVRLLDDGQRLGRSFDHFKRTYFAATDYQQYNWEPIPGAAERIDERIADITLTLRTSDWVKDLPDCYVNDVEVKLPPAVMAQYEEFKKELILELRREVQITAANAAVLVRKLLQFTSGAIYDGEKKAHEVHDYKTEALAKLIKETKGPVLVLCDFKHEQDRIRRKFPQARFFADARTPTLQMQLITQWNRREIPILVGHPMSMGHGLNLQQGSKTMVWMSLTYSRESYEQTIARLHRRGQKEVVTVHRLMVPGTVDDVVAEVLEEKRNTEQRLLTALMLLEGDHKGRTPLKFAPEPETEFNEEAFWG